VPSVIVASDVSIVRRGIISALDEPGMVVKEASSGKEVLDLVAAVSPDLVLADMQIGNMGGMAICMELRLEESYGHLPHVGVILLLDRRADVFLARRSGANGWLIKPLDPLRLRAAVKAVSSGDSYLDPSYEPLPSTSLPTASSGGK
jgi:DNA-binding NarL/FixJ family response regulator